MKNLILVFVVAFAFCTTAMASDIAFYVGQWNTDGWYDASQFDDVDTIIAQTGHLFNDIQQFDDTELAAFGTWVDDHTNNGVMDIIWLNGCTPTVLYPQGNTSPDGSRAELWLDGGNMIINVGDWFAYCSFEGGTRLDPDNGSAGAANILDLDASVIDDGTNAAPMVVTAAGATYLPSLNQVTSTRPVVLSQVTGDWEVAEVFAQNAAGTYADPVVIHNTATDGYLAIINQSTNWIADRGQTCAEFIANWARGLLSANPYPFNPSPTDGSTIDGYLYPPDYIYVVLTFEEGDWADSHVVYFSDNEALVNALDPSVSLGGPPDPLNPRTFYAGVPLPEWTPYNDSLVRGNTYYWCAVTTDVNGTPWQGPTWDFYVALAKASNPSPADGAKFLSLDPTLSWGAGVTEGYSSPHAHEIYFGTNYDDVNNATAGGPLHRATQSFGDETWEPNSDGGLTLDYSTDYYWRIDEKHGSFTITRVTGDVWKFTTGREGGGLRADFFEFPAQATPSRAVAFANLVHTRFDPEINFTWLAGPPDPCVAADGFASRWVGAVEAGWTETYTFNARTDDGVRLWIGGELIIDDWVEQGMSDAFSTTVNLVAGQKYSLMMEQYENGGDAGAQLLWTSPSTDWEIVPSGALYPPYWAYNPDPPNGAHTVDPAEFVQCTWTSGDYTAQHKVYWCEGDDPNLLTLVATKPVGEPNYDPGPLALETNYCWRVDEVNGTDVWQGDVWRFSTVREYGMGTIIGEGWLNIGGTDLNILKNDPRYPDYPDFTAEISSFDTVTGLGSADLYSDYGGRIHGWLVPDTTGDYRFWLSTDDQGELYLNYDGPDYLDVTDPANQKYLIAYVKDQPAASSGTGWAPPDMWWPQNNNNHPEADSNNVVGLIHLEADQKYYICGLWKEAGGGDQCQVAWMGPDQPDLPVDGSRDAIIDGYYLMPFTRLWASNPKPRHRQELSAEEVTQLGWMPGIEAAGHRLWFDDDPNVTDAPLIYAELPLAANSVNPSNYGVTIEWEKTYWWKVTEVNDANVWDGSIWWFTTTNYAYPENFERYDKAGPSSGDPLALRYRWKDGFSTFPVVGSGSNVMLAGLRDEPPRPYLHYDDYTEGAQALVFYYDNDGNTFVPGYYDWQGYGYPAPKYSEISALTSGTTGIGLGQDWLRKDIKALSLWFKGNPRRTGSAVIVGNTATITSDGADIWNVGPNPYHDEFHYAYNNLLKGTNWAGLGIITARVDSVANTNAWAKAGVMMRESPFPDANHAMLVVTPGSGVSFQYRDVKRGASSETTVAGITAPHWVRLERDSYGRFVATHANDVEQAAGNWQLIGPATGQVVDMDPNIYAGLCLTSHNAAAMCTAVFSNISIVPTGGSTVGPGWQNRDIGIITNEPPHPRMYIALEDALHNVAVKYHDDVNAVLIETWTPWDIDLMDFNTINPALRLDLIDKVYLGFGDRGTPTTAGSGVVYFDDIKLYRSRFIPGMFPALPTNLVYDEGINFLDVEVMANDWLLADSNSTPATDPTDANMVAKYLFEGDLTDSGLPPANNGTAYGSPTYSTDSIEGTYSISLSSATSDYIDCGSDPTLNITGGVTVAAWIKLSQGGLDQKIASNQDGVTGGYKMGIFSDDTAEFEIRTSANAAFLNRGVAGGTVLRTDDWYHVAGVYSEGNYIRTYVNGVLDRELVTTEILGTSTGAFMLGREPTGANYFNGQMDDVRIYNRALTAPEVAYLVDIYDSSPGDGWLHVEIDSIANLYNDEPEGLQWINFKDFAILAEDWLKKEPTWPTW